MAVTTKQHEEQLRKTLSDLLHLCTDSQQEFFKKLYPMGIDKIPYEKLNLATQQCQRTIQKNKEKIDGKLTEFQQLMMESAKGVKQADTIVSITTQEEVLIPLEKLKPTPEFKCYECGETNPELQYLGSEYCHICINK